MRGVIENPLPRRHEAGVSLVVAAGVEVAIVFWDPADATVTRSR
jgi:hypothetical protein